MQAPPPSSPYCEPNCALAQTHDVMISCHVVGGAQLLEATAQAICLSHSWEKWREAKHLLGFPTQETGAQAIVSHGHGWEKWQETACPLSAVAGATLLSRSLECPGGRCSHCFCSAYHLGTPSHVSGKIAFTGERVRALQLLPNWGTIGAHALASPLEAPRACSILCCRADMPRIRHFSSF